jgi:hypothetical protein
MRGFDTQTLETDLHRLDLRFASLRMRQPRVVERLARSIARQAKQAQSHHTTICYGATKQPECVL